MMKASAVKVVEASRSAVPREGVCLYQHQRPWKRNPCFEESLKKQSQSFTIVSDVAKIDWDKIAVLIIPGGQLANHYNAMEQAKDQLAKFVQSGGVLLCEMNWMEKSNGTEKWMPGKVKMVHNCDEYNYVDKPNHPLLEGYNPNNRIGRAKWMSSGYLKDYPENCEKLLITYDHNKTPKKNMEQPTYIVYSHGEGKVVAACQCFHSRDGSGREPLLHASIKWCAAQAKAIQETLKEKALAAREEALKKREAALQAPSAAAAAPAAEEEKKEDAAEPKGKHFISYKQNESKDLAMEFWYKFGQNKGAWLDVKNEAGQSKEDMMKGVKESDVFLLLMTPGYFDSDYCAMECAYAIELGKPMKCVYNTDMMAKAGFGEQLGKASEKGICVEDWPSAMGISTGSMEKLFPSIRDSISKVVKKAKNWSWGEAKEAEWTLQGFLEGIGPAFVKNYLKIFEEEGLTSLDDLKEYSQDDLKELGVKGVHSKRIHKAAHSE